MAVFRDLILKVSHRLRNRERSHAQDDDRACGSIFRLHGNDDVRYPAAFRVVAAVLAGALMALVEAALEATNSRWAAVPAGILEAALAFLAAAFGTGASVDLDLASMDTRAGCTQIRLWRLFGIPCQRLPLGLLLTSNTEIS